MSKPSTLNIHKPRLEGQVLTCSYSFENETFENSYSFPRPFPDPISDKVLKLCDWLAIVTGFGLFSIEYFDYLQTDFELSEQETEFFEKLMYFGLGEFRYVNKIPITKKTKLAGTHLPAKATEVNAENRESSAGPLLLNGGGKDGSVSALLLNEAGIKFTWFQRGDTVSQANVVKAWEAPVLIVDRELDASRKDRKYAGHRPISAGLALLALLSAVLYDFSAVIASNELSANEGNLTLDGFSVNHQYSKSLEFEKDIQGLLSLFGISTTYFSLLRPLHELQIGLIATHLKANQLRAITSCNHGTKYGKWCMACAKCAFVVLTITAASPTAAEKVWGDQMINSPGLLPYLVELLDPTTDKPFECVGTLEECQLAAYMIIQDKEIELEPAVKDVLEKFASNKASWLLGKLGESLIPKDYEQVKNLMSKSLEQWSGSI